MEIQYRASKSDIQAEENKIKGYAVVYNSLSEPLNFGNYSFREKILPGAFDRVLSEERDIKCLFNHDKNKVIGRTTNNTLQLRSDEKGLYFECEYNPEITWQNDLVKSMKRGDIDQCSFAFTIDSKGKKETTVENDSEVNTLREISEIKDLYEVSVVTFPAYKETEAYARDCQALIDSYEKEKQKKEEAEKQKEIDIVETMLML